MPDQIALPSDADLLSRLADVLGPDGLILGAAAAPFYTDVLRARETPLAILRPASVEALRQATKMAAAACIAIFPRGGGASYTDAFLPTVARSIIMDTGRLDRIIEINETDATVTVEAGVTWAKLKAALDPLGLRTPFFGPFSGLAATIGGSMSQHTISHGSGAHGISAQSVISMEIVLASGDLLRTTAGNAHPFTRYYGPDLTGLFTGDCGAFGIKARITLPLFAAKLYFDALSFAFSDFSGLSEALRQLARERLDDEHFALDAALSRGQIARQDMGSVLHAARSVLTSARNPFAAVTQLARMALAGTKALANSAYTLHVIVEGANRAEALAKAARVREIMKAGQEIANTIPALVRGMPFAPLFNTLGPAGERWVPVHGILAHSRVAGFHAALQALYAELANEMAARAVWVGGMFTTSGPSGFLYEIALYWPGAKTAYHRAAVPNDYLSKLPNYTDDPAATALAMNLKEKIVALFEQFGAAHYQVGRMYPYQTALAAPTSALLKAIKVELDTDHLINPGVLGVSKDR
jgi:D-lactate dehydrogenase (cytochrome)